MKKKWWLILVGINIFSILAIIISYTGIRHQNDNKQIVSSIPTPSTTIAIPFASPQSITLAFVGDISLNREVNWQIAKRNDPTFPFLKTADVLKSGDLTIGNLEGPLIENCPPVRTGMIFCGNTKNVNGLVFAGFDLVNLANNHINNYENLGFQQTIQTLSNAKIDWFNENQIIYKQINGLKLAFLGFDDIVRPIDKAFLAEKINEAKTNADFIAINFHWGNEYQKYPNKRQKILAHLAIDNGADLIVGHHPHVLQPVEYYKDKPILYSLGNFVFDQMWSEETRIGAIAKVTIDENRSTKVELFPVKIYEYCRPDLIPEPQKTEIIKWMFNNITI